MTIDYAAEARNAARTIAKFGQVGLLRQAGATSGPTWAPIAGQDIDTPCNIVVMAYNTADIRTGTTEGVDSLLLIKAGDKKVYVEAVGIPKPTTTDRLVIGGEVNTIISVSEINPAGIPLLYTCQCRV